MVRKIKFEIEIPDRLSIWEDSDIYDEETAFQKLGKEETIKFQEEKTEELYNYLKNNITDLLEGEENFVIGINENVICIEDWDSLEDWGIKIKVIE